MLQLPPGIYTRLGGFVARQLQGDLPLHRAAGQAADEVALQREEEEHHRQDREQRAGHEHAVLGVEAGEADHGASPIGNVCFDSSWRTMLGHSSCSMIR